MPIFDLYSKRQRRLKGEVSDVYIYDEVPQKLRVQIVHIIRDITGEPDLYYHASTNEIYEFIHNALCQEYGVFNLTNNSTTDCESIFNFLLNTKDVEQVLDTIELTFRVIAAFARERGFSAHEAKITIGDGIAELNERFKEHGIGFRYESGEIVRVDSEYLHAEAVKPTLTILREKNYQGANEEFLKAHEHYRHGRHKECLVETLKAFESTMKAICEKRKWTFKQNDTAKNLIDICLKNNLIPPYMQSEFTALRSLLESGVPTLRNKLGGHGQGSQPTVVPEFIARYALHLTATNILFLADAERAMR